MAKPAVTGEIRDVDFSEELGQRYLSYALSTIMARSLPDVRDGLKPVHRRLLFAMRELRLDPKSGPKKCARVVGDVMGKYHPHGDQSIYDALVRLAQEFSQRYPLIDGQGNFGNIDGDNPAAMRYTESRLTELAEALLDGIDENAVDFRPTYDGEGEEPVILPARFPNLLANGAAGIAVGMATSIPPQNLGELCEALLHLIATPKCDPAELVQFVRGPDFPTGGVLVESAENIRQAYATGRGSFRLRARWKQNQLSHGMYQVIVTEIPYQVKKSQLVEKIAGLLEEKKLPLLADVRDESAEEVRLVLEPKSRNVSAEVLMESLFRATQLEVRVPLNLNVLDSQGVPRVMSLKEALQEFLDHRRVVLQRRTQHRLDAIARRMEILRGHIIVYLNIDEVIRIIREEDDPKARMQKRWKLSDMQVEAILNMRLRSLRKLEEIAIKKELKDLASEEEDLQGLLGSTKRQWRSIGKEIGELKKEFGSGRLGARRTEIGMPPAAIMVPVEALVERENVTVVCSAKGWIRAAKGHGLNPDEIKYKEGDSGRFLIQAETTDKLAVFATNGRFYTLPVDKLPGGRGHGEPLRLMIDLPNEHDIVTLFPWRAGQKLLLAATDGRGFVTTTDELLAGTRGGKQVMSVGDGAQARICLPVQGDAVAFLGENRKMLIVKLDEIPELGRGRGVILQKYKGGGLIDARMVTIAEGMTVRQGEVRTRHEADLSPWLGARATSGRLAPKEIVRSGKL